MGLTAAARVFSGMAEPGTSPLYIPLRARAQHGGALLEALRAFLCRPGGRSGRPALAPPPQPPGHNRRVLSSLCELYAKSFFPGDPGRGLRRLQAVCALPRGRPRKSRPQDPGLRRPREHRWAHPDPAEKRDVVLPRVTWRRGRGRWRPHPDGKRALSLLVRLGPSPGLSELP